MENNNTVNTSIENLPEDSESKGNPALDVVSSANVSDVKGLLDEVVEIVGEIVSNINLSI